MPNDYSNPRQVVKEQRQVDSLLRDLTAQAAGKKELPALKREEPRGGIPQRRGYSEQNLQPGTGEAGGVIGPLVEGTTADPDAPANTPVLDREDYPVQQFVTSDGLFVWELTPVKQINFRDGLGNPLPVIIANPYAEEEPAP